MISSDRLVAQAEIYNFLRSVTIKYEPLAHYLNESLVRKGIRVNYQDKTTWKYYLNLIGQYHSSDTKMYVVSEDTHQTILFSPEILVDHPRTRSRYVPGGAYYNRLCDLYPEQVDLVKSILFPVESMEKALLAEDLTMLRYGDGYLEDDELSPMVKAVTDFLDTYKERWYFDFLDDEPYFYLTAWSCLWVQLAGVLMSQRLSHIHTAYVHSSDIWDALKAEGIDNYSDILNREKQMMLYQSINYFKQNAGKQSNMLILADRLLKDLGIGLYGRKVVQETETGADNYQLTPQLVPVRLTQTPGASASLVETKTVQVVQNELLDQGLTDSDTAEKVAAIERKLGDTRLNDFATKILEIRPIAQNKPYAELLNLFLLETLMVSVQQGYYTKPVQIIEPLTREVMYLTPKEHIALFNYAVHKSMGHTITAFPNKILLNHSFTTTIGTPTEFIPYRTNKLYLWQCADVPAYLSGLEYDTQVQNPKEFSDNATQLWLKWMEHMLLDQKTSMENFRAVYAYLHSLCHQKREETIDLIPGFANYETWLGAEGINFTDTIGVQYDLQVNPQEQWANLADTCITALCPLNDTLRFFGNFTLSDSGYHRLRDLFIQLCSYQVVFLQANRQTDEFAGSAKWSHAYGPEVVSLNSEEIFPTELRTESKIVLAHPINLDAGVTKHEATKASIHQDYNVTSYMTFTGDHADATVEQTLPSTIIDTTRKAVGDLYLSHNAVQIVD